MMIWGVTVSFVVAAALLGVLLAVIEDRRRVRDELAHSRAVTRYERERAARWRWRAEQAERALEAAAAPWPLYEPGAGRPWVEPAQ